MSIKTWLALVLVFFLTAAALAVQRPNIVYIMVDDMGYGDPTCYNPESKTPTPNIDRLARDGMRFTDAHAAGTTCVPSRFGLMTGKYPFRGDLDNRKKGGPVIPEGRLTLPGMLKRAGYATAMVGKWHLGMEHEKEPGNKRLSGGPVDRGFDTFFGMPASLDIPPYYYIRGARAIDPPTDRAGDNASMELGWTRIQGAFWRAGGQAPGFRHEDVLDVFQKESIKRLRAHQKEALGKPIFLYVPLTGPHTPWLPFKEYKGKSGAAMYGDFVMSVDHVVGAILDELDKLEMADDTMVVFTSDNGPVWYDNDEEKYDHVSTG
ncbi:MAG: sulfatase-like hydrolase/transferase, partial [Planctomycetota bacterium]